MLIARSSSLRGRFGHYRVRGYEAKSGGFRIGVRESRSSGFRCEGICVYWGFEFFFFVVFVFFVIVGGLVFFFTNRARDVHV